MTKTSEQEQTRRSGAVRTMTSPEMRPLRVGARVRILIGAPRFGVVQNVSRRSARPATMNYRVEYNDNGTKRASWFWPCDLERDQ